MVVLGALVTAQIVQVHPFQGTDVGGFEHHFRCGARIQGFLPPGGAEAPAVSGLESGETGLGAAEVVADAPAELEELGRHPGAHHMGAQVIGTGVAAPVPVEAGERVEAARLQLLTENVLRHDPI